MNRLLEIGFKPVGHWLLGERGPMLHLRALTESRNILYAFVTDGEVKYIGKTTQQLKARMLGYQRPAATQATNVRNHGNIDGLLKQGKTVDIFALPDNGLLHYGTFHVNLAAGLEDSLIATVRPEWNGQRMAERMSGGEGEVAEERVVPGSEKQDMSPGGACDAAGPARVESGTAMLLVLQLTYFNQGFFNVPVDYQRYFGNHLEKIDMYCGAERLHVAGYVNRTANANGTPRIMGGAQLKCWMQRVAHVMGEIDVLIQSPASILLLPRTGT